MVFRNFIFSTIFALVLTGPLLIHKAAETAEIDLPFWISNSSVEYLTGAKTNTSMYQYFNLEDIQTGALQEALSNAIESYIPARSIALLGNAALQYHFIDASNALFNYPCYPTYFGNEVLYCLETRGLLQMPLPKDESLITRLDSFGKNLRSFAERHPDKSICVIIPDISCTSSANPAYQLVTDSFTTEECADLIRGSHGTPPNMHVIDVTYSTISEYSKDFYLTDHHWNGYGATKAYIALMESLDLPIVPNHNGKYQSNAIKENGSLARGALHLINQPLDEPKFDIDELEVQSEYPELIFSNNPVEELVSTGWKGDFVFYGLLYGAEEPMTITNTNGAVSGNVLMICDSYGQAFRWLLANNYKYTFVNTYRRNGNNETLISKMDETDSDTVVYMLWADHFPKTENGDAEYLSN